MLKVKVTFLWQIENPVLLSTIVIVNRGAGWVEKAAHKAREEFSGETAKANMVCVQIDVLENREII